MLLISLSFCLGAAIILAFLAPLSAIGLYIGTYTCCLIPKILLLRIIFCDVIRLHPGRFRRILAIWERLLLDRAESRHHWNSGERSTIDNPLLFYAKPKVPTFLLPGLPLCSWLRFRRDVVRSSGGLPQLCLSDQHDLGGPGTNNHPLDSIRAHVGRGKVKNKAYQAEINRLPE